MKKFYLLVVCAIGFFFIAAPIYMKYPVSVNGRPGITAQFVNNTWAVPLEEFTKAFGGGITLEPYFQLQGNKLVSISSGGDKTAKKVVEASTTPNTIGGSSATIKLGNPGTFHVRKAGIVSNNVFGFEGKAYVPLADVARAFGGSFTPPAGNLQPGQSLTLNFANNANALLGAN